jgi:Fe-S cluster biogenesis protein NfuA
MDRQVEIESVLANIRPAMRADGGDVEFVGIDGDVVLVRLCGTCLACPSKNMTLKLGIEKTVKENLPWVGSVIRVS